MRTDRPETAGGGSRGAGGVKATRGASNVAKELVSKSKNKPAIKAEDRFFTKTKSGRKDMKQQDIYFNKAGKEDLKSGKVTDVSKITASKSRSASSTTKVPVKKKGK